MGGHHMHEHGHTPEVHGYADAWHHHDASSEGAPQTEHAGVVSTATVTVWLTGISIIVVLTVVSMLGYFGLYLSPLKAQTEEREAWTRLSQPARDYKRVLLASQADPKHTESLPGVKVVPPAISIDQAMDKTASQYRPAK